MDLNSALNLNKYKDYHDTETRDHDYNQNIVNRIFDISPLLSNNNYQLTNQPLPNNNTPQMCSVEKSTPLQLQNTNMSHQYLLMKHAQEKETLMENPSVNLIALQQLKKEQNDETKRVNQTSMNNCLPTPTQQPSILTPTYPTYPTNQTFLNQTRDVYDQTNYKDISNNQVTRSLQKQMDMRHKTILSQKQNIQSYKNNQFGTNIDDAYSDIF